MDAIVLEIVVGALPILCKWIIYSSKSSFKIVLIWTFLFSFSKYSNNFLTSRIYDSSVLGDIFFFYAIVKQIHLLNPAYSYPFSYRCIPYYISVFYKIKLFFTYLFTIICALYNIYYWGFWKKQYIVILWFFNIFDIFLDKFS